MKLEADVINGVYHVNDFDDTAKIYTNEDDFYDDLWHLSGKEVIACDVSLSMAKKIKKEYGIH